MTEGPPATPPAEAPRAAAADEPAVLLDRCGQIAMITLNRPARANVFSTDVRAGLFQAAREIAADPSIHVVILTGAGEHFSGGADLRESREVRATARKRYPGAADLSGIPQPVIAAINGSALGGGCEIALSCDFRFMAEGARIGLTEIRFGALPLAGGTARLPRLVGLAAARRMIMTGEPIDAAEAARIGLADRVVPAEQLMAAAEQFASTLAGRATYAMRAAKQLLNVTLDLDLAEAMELERRMVRSMASRDQLAAAQEDAARHIPAYARIFGPPLDRSAVRPSAGKAAQSAGQPVDGVSPAPGIEVTGRAQQEAWAAGRLPPVEQVRPGLWSIPVTIPGSTLRYTLAYTLELPGGVALIDSGWDSRLAWDGLVDGLAVAGFDVTDVRAVVATHIHPDHYGLVARLREASGAWVGLHAQDAAMVGTGEEEEMRVALAARWDDLHRRIGIPAALGGATGMTDRRARKYLMRTPPDVLIEDGARLELPGWDLRAIWTPGHSPGHLCFFEERLGLLLAGDHVLPRITPNVSVHSRQRPDPLGDYLRSLAIVGGLPAVEVLPAHEYRFRGLRERVGQLLSHHETRLAEIEQSIVAEPGLSCWAIAAGLTWSRPFGALSAAAQHAAAREALAHLLELSARGRIVGDDAEPQRWFPADG